jgi:DNA polymerase-3 subunit gamma/tau
MHTSLYRKYRSHTFSEMVGQSHIVTILSNAITHNRLSHAYIFSGPRGTGKTSTARILAKALNCRNGATPTPCMTCDLCLKITAGQAVDVIEIDAASHTGVDNIRTLNDQVNFSPVECRVKFYIIDEAHMLSSGAFNALLKTIEEPPANTVFILATTEAHKIPATILSRCQQLHFKKLTTAQIVGQLTHICQAEQIQVEPEALHKLAQLAGGCMRDAISLLEQVRAFSTDTVQAQDVDAVLGLLSTSEMASLLTAIGRSDTVAVIGQLDQILSKGANPHYFIQMLLKVTHDCVLIHAGQTVADLDAQTTDQLQALCRQLPPETLYRILDATAKLENELRYFMDPELLIRARMVLLAAPQGISAVAAPVVAASLVRSQTPEIPSPMPEPLVPSEPSQPRPQPEVQPVIPSTAPDPAAPPEKPASPQPEPQADDVQAQWHNVLVTIKKQKPSLFMILQGSRVVEVTSSEVVLQLHQNYKFFHEKIKESAHQSLLEQVLHTNFGRPLRIALGGATATPTVSAPNATSAAAPSSSTTATTPETPAPSPSQKSRSVNDIVSLFEGTLVS